MQFGEISIAKSLALPVFNETTIELFIIWSIMLFLIFWHEKDVEYGFQSAYMIVVVHLTGVMY